MKDFRDNPTDYPYGWTQGIEEFCHDNDHHPDCTQPICRAFIKKEFIASIINKPDSLHLLDNYLQTIYNNRFGRNLQWPHSSPAPIKDNHQECSQLTQLYAEVDKNQGCIFHTQQGLQITIPEEKWINWKMFSPNSKVSFMQVAWAQLTQFNKSALMTGIHQGKLDDITIFFDFDEHAKHDKFWTTELESVRQYYIELITQMGVYHYYNSYVMQDLAYNNKPLDLPLITNWKIEGRPQFIFLPYSQTLLKWNSNLNKWEYENHTKDSLSYCGLSSLSSCNCDHCSMPSFIEPIDEFEKEDQEK